MEASLKTAMLLLDYEDQLEPLDIYSLIATIACFARAFHQASRAFCKLETSPKIAVELREQFEQLAFTIFTKYVFTNKNGVVDGVAL